MRAPWPHQDSVASSSAWWPDLLPPLGWFSAYSFSIASRVCRHGPTQDHIQRRGLSVAQVASEVLRDGADEHAPRAPPLGPPPIRQHGARTAPVRGVVLP